MAEAAADRPPSGAVFETSRAAGRGRGAGPSHVFCAVGWDGVHPVHVERGPLDISRPISAGELAMPMGPGTSAAREDAEPCPVIAAPQARMPERVPTVSEAAGTVATASAARRRSPIKPGPADTAPSSRSSRIGAGAPRDLATGSEVAAPHGAQRFEAVLPRHREIGEERCVETRGPLVVAGAAPHADWLRGAIELGDHGLVVAGRGGDPPATAKPGLLAAGDVRPGSVARVASAQGQGAVAIPRARRAIGGSRETPGVRADTRDASTG